MLTLPHRRKMDKLCLLIVIATLLNLVSGSVWTQGRELSPFRVKDLLKEPSCEFSCAGKPDGKYGNPLNCHEYIICLNGVGTTFECDDVQDFDVSFGECLYHDYSPGNCAECPPATTTSPTEPTSTAPPTTNPPTTNSPTTNPTTTNPPTTNPTTTNPPTTAPPTTTTTLPVTAPSTTLPTTEPTTSEPEDSCDFSCSGKPDGSYPNGWDCKSYITCYHGVTYPGQCVNGQFNPETKECEYPDVVNCLDACSMTPATEPPITEMTTSIVTITPGTEPTTTETTVDPCDFTCEEKVNGNYANPFTCAGYFVCLSGKRYPFWCAGKGDQQFNPVTKRCDDGESAGCVELCLN